MAINHHLISRSAMLTQQLINDVMQQGNDAYLDKKDKQSPYPSYSEENRLWMRGYANARYMSALERG